MDAIWYAVAAVLLGVVVCPMAAEGAWVRVERYGAVPNDGKDDTAAVLKAIARVEGRSRNFLIFGEDAAYDFFAGENPDRKEDSLVLRNCRKLIVDGNGAALTFHGLTRGIVLEDCEEVVIKDLFIDYEPLPFSVGKLLGVDENSLEVEVFPDYPVEGGEPVQAFMEYDSDTRLPLKRGVDSYHNVESTELVRPQVLRLHLEKPVQATEGSLLILRHQVYSYNAFSLRGCSKIRFQNVTVYSAPGMGLAAQHSSFVELDRFNVVIKPDSGRMMSTTADATHFNSCRGGIIIKDCRFEGMGDDATNVHGMYHRIFKKEDDRTLLTTCRNNWIIEPDVGDVMEFTDFTTLVPYDSGTVQKVEVNRKEGFHRIVFKAPVPDRLRIGDVLGNVNWAPELEIRNCVVAGNRARGFLVQTRNAVIENNAFLHVSGAALHVCADADYWTESIGVRNVVISDNSIVDCNYGAAMGSGAIRVFAEVKGGRAAAVGANQDVTITGNVIDGTDNAAIYVASTDGAVIRDNVIRKACRNPSRPEGGSAIFLMNAANVKVTGNRIDPDAKGEGMERTFTIGPGCKEDTMSVKGNTGF